MTRSETGFWQPKFEIQRRADGSILMSQQGQAAPLATSIPERIGYWAAKPPMLQPLPHDMMATVTAPPLPRSKATRSAWYPAARAI